MLDISLAGVAQPLRLLPGGAVFLPRLQMLLVADAHFGKAVSFRRWGVPVPEGTTAGTLERLDTLVSLTAASHVVFLGDFLHSAWAHAPSTQQALAAWRQQNPTLGLTLVRGNHDDRAGDPPASLQMVVVDEPLRVGADGPGTGLGLALCHHPQPVAGAYVLAGHWHPCVSLSGAARDRLRLPCFWLGDASIHPVGILPAFGSFTGMHPIERRIRDRVFAVAGQVVREVPAL
jgi:DNA ligase-associated metallophosphoesterase